MTQEYWAPSMVVWGHLHCILRLSEGILHCKDWAPFCNDGHQFAKISTMVSNWFWPKLNILHRKYLRGIIFILKQTVKFFWFCLALVGAHWWVQAYHWLTTSHALLSPWILALINGYWFKKSLQSTTVTRELRKITGTILAQWSGIICKAHLAIMWILFIMT